MYKIILHGIKVRLDERILIWIFVAMCTNDEATQGHYLVEWLIEIYTVQVNTAMKGVDPFHPIFSGEIICNAVF